MWRCALLTVDRHRRCPGADEESVGRTRAPLWAWCIYVTTKHERTTDADGPAAFAASASAPRRRTPGRVPGSRERRWLLQIETAPVLQQHSAAEGEAHHYGTHALPSAKRVTSAFTAVLRVPEIVLHCERSELDNRPATTLHQCLQCLVASDSFPPNAPPGRRRALRNLPRPPPCFCTVLCSLSIIMRVCLLVPNTVTRWLMLTA